MKHGNFKASRAADIYYDNNNNNNNNNNDNNNNNNNNKNGPLSLYLKYNFLTAGFYYTLLVIVMSKKQPLTSDKTVWWETETSWTGFENRW